MMGDRSMAGNGGTHLRKGDKEEVSPMENKGLSKKSKIIIAACVGVVLLLALAVVLLVHSKLSLIDYNDGKLAEGTVTTFKEDNDTDLAGLKMVDSTNAKVLDTMAEDGKLNILLLGTDGLSYEYIDDVRADAVMILGLDLNSKTAKLVSIERAMGFPLLDGKQAGEYTKITSCFNYGGADLVMREIQTYLGIEANRYVRINFYSLIKVVDILGGIDVDLTEQEAWYINAMANGDSVGHYLYHGFIRDKDSKNEMIELKEGMNHLNGEYALCYARLRAIDSDWHRIERQRTVIQACVNKIGDASVSTLNELLNEILPLVRTNFTESEIAALMVKAPGFLNVKFDQLTIPVEGTYSGMVGLNSISLLAPDYETNAKILQEFLYGKSDLGK